MRSWGNLVGAANRIDAELRNDHGSSELTDIATREVLVKIAVSSRFAPLDRDRVLRAATDGAISEIRRRGA